ncbi:MAG: DUF4968 domain-containing protein [Planctomycetia bacterium]|nr:DUF4968 domain-containing protein [Planctomycetia bacterium]MCC7316285.1 glycoside hydrolase family 31 protein [Planctomycetota bacterium]
MSNNNGGETGLLSRAMRGWRSLGDVTSYRQENGGLLIECDESRVLISPITDEIVRVRLAPEGEFGRDHSWAVITDESGARPHWGLEENGDAMEMVTNTLRVRISRSPCRISFHHLDGAVILGDCPTRGMAWAGDEIRCWKQLGEEDHFFGLGEKGSPMDKRGTALVNWNHDAAEHDPWTDPLYQTHPFALVLNNGRAHGLFFDNACRSFFDFGKTSRDAYCFGADTGEMNYYFIAGPAPADVVQRYASLVGAMPLPPRWSLGYQQCRWSYDSAARVKEIARQFRKRKIPCDTIYIDIDYMDEFRSFTWHPKRFSNPRKLTEQLTSKGFKLVGIIDPGIKCEKGYSVYDSGVAGDHFVRAADGELYVGKVWPGESVWPDYTRGATRRWWADLYANFLKDGVGGIWNDMNEPADFTFADGTIPLTVRHDNDGAPTDHRAVHNVYGMQMARATFDGMKRTRPKERPFVLTRAGYSGVQRYAAVWTGDNLSSWEHLRMSVPMLLNMSLSGVTLCGADIGGFRGYPSAELFTRWLQLGVFYPLMRVHTAGGKEQDPWSFGKKAEKHNREAIELRYRLLPYVYTEMHHASRTGLPLLRPVLLDFPSHPKAHRCEHEFMFGRQLFVAPVVHEGATTRKVTLPAGEWYDFDSGAVREGGVEFERPVHLRTIPIFARAGAIIPTREVRQYSEEKAIKELTLNIFPGSGRGWFYNDDGISYGYEQGEFLLEQYATGPSDGGTSFRVIWREGSAQFIPKSYLLRFAGISKCPDAVTVDGRPLTACPTVGRMTRARAGWFFDRKQRSVLVRVAELPESATVEVLGNFRK